MEIGTVKWFNATKGYGFITPEGREKKNDVFVHISVVANAGIGNLQEGQKVRYETETNANGKTAVKTLQAL